MVKQDYYMTRNDGVRLIKTYSDSNKYIIQVETGIEYDVAIDVFPLKYTYIESDKYIEVTNND
jgi:hypothetical protein